MEPLLWQVPVAATGVLAVGLSIWAYVKWRARLVAAWRRAASELGLTFSRGGFRGWNITGTVGDLAVVVDTVTRNYGKYSQTNTRIAVDGRGAFDLGITLKPESAWEGFKKVFSGEDVEIGDETFDEAVNAKGREDALLAALHQEARHAARHMVAQKAEVKEGKVLFEVAGVMNDSARMVALVRCFAEAANALRVPSVEKALQRNAKEDPNPGVRLRNLGALVEHHRSKPETRAALEAALDDQSAEIQLFAAGRLLTGPRVQAVLEQLFDEPALAEPQRAEVLSLLVETLPYQAVAARVARALEDRSEALCAVAVAAAGRAKDAAVLLARPALASTPDPGLGAALAVALGQACGAAGEPMLLELLKSQTPEVQVAAAQALGVAGTVRSVEPLLPLTEGLLADGALKEAAREAVRGIQARLGEVQAGGLSVVDERAGEGGLSIEAGRKTERDGG